MHRIWNFVITGGPCSGKTTGLEALEKYFSEKGFKVIMFPETATQVIGSGIPFKETPALIFQECILDISLVREDATRKLANCLSDYHDKDIIIFYDRGLMDGKAYVSSGFDEILTARAFTEKNVNERYDAVFHLVTAADGAVEYYTLSNNGARTETPEEARELDAKTFDAWKGHKNLYRIDNSTSFDEKINRLINYVEKEIERKK